MSEVKKYAVTVEASDVEGSQTFAVFGTSVEDARRNYRNGETAGIISENLEVVGLDTILEIEESDHISDLPSDVIENKDARIKELEALVSVMAQELIDQEMIGKRDDGIYYWRSCGEALLPSQDGEL